MTQKKLSGLRLRLRNWVHSVPRYHLAILFLIAVVGFLRGLFWVATAEVWNPIDEAQHYAYVQSLATGHGMPVVGVDHVPVEVLSVAKVSPTLGFRYYPFQVKQDPSWGAFGEQYEGGGSQGPLYYALMVVPYWLSRPFGVLESVYAIRMASVLVSLLAVPLTWLLARELFPRRPVVWLAAAALLVTIQGFNSNLASINNDALMVPVAVAALIPIARAWRSLALGQAAAGGALCAVAVLTKSTNLALGPMVGLVLVALIVSGRQPIGRVIRWSLLFGGAAVMFLLPYLAWNQLVYGAPSAADEVEAIVGPLWPHVPATFDGLRTIWGNARIGFWDFQPYKPGPGSYGSVFEWSAVIAVVIGVIAALARRSRGEAAALTWLAAAFPLALVTKVGMAYATFHVLSIAVGRHLYTALAPMSILVAAGSVIALGPRWGVVALLVVVALALGREEGTVRSYVDAAYTPGMTGSNLVPLVDQTWNDEYVLTQVVRVSPPCPAEAVGLGINGLAPTEVMVVESPVQHPARFTGSIGNIAVYALDTPVSTPFRIQLSAPTPVGSSRLDRDPRVAFVDGPGDPMVQVYCRSDDAQALRFAQRYGPQHPPGVTYHRIWLWTGAWKWAGRAALALAFAIVVPLEVVPLLRRRSTSSSPRPRGSDRP